MEIGKRGENWKNRGRYVGKDMEIESTVVFRVFMSLFFLWLKILGYLWNKKPIHDVKLIVYLLSFQSQKESYSFITFIFQLHLEMVHLCFLKHFHHGVCNFHLMFFVNTAVDLISNWFLAHLQVNYKKYQPIIYESTLVQAWK